MLAATNSALAAAVNTRTDAVRIEIAGSAFVLVRVKSSPQMPTSLAALSTHLHEAVAARLVQTVGAATAGAPLNATAFDILRGDPEFVPAVLEQVRAALAHAVATGGNRRPKMHYEVRAL